jgi:hypothetical protein
MPKQIYKIEHFHGGLNSNSDPRDISTTELSSATDVMVDEVGSIRTIGNIQATYETLDNAGATVTEIAGAGFFQFDHDRTGAEDAGTSEDETGDSYLALYDDNDAEIWVYSKAVTNWDDDVAVNEHGVITFDGKGTSGAAKPVFTSIDGAVRVSSGEFAKYDSGADINDGSHFLTTETSFAVDDGDGTTDDYTLSVGNYIQIDDEILYISGKSTNTITVTRGMFGTKVAQHQDNAQVDILNMNQWYGYLNDNFFQTSVGESEYTTDKWYNEIQHLRSLDELGITLALDDSTSASPDATALAADKIIVSHWLSKDGFWNGSYWLGMTPVYIGGQEGPISTIGSDTIQMNENVLNVQLYICHPTIDNTAISAHPLKDDRIIGLKLYTKAYTSDEWFLLKQFDLLEGGEHGWAEYTAGDVDQTTTGFWTDGTVDGLSSGIAADLADTSPSLDSYEPGTAVVKVEPGTAMGAGRKGILRVSGFQVSPLYATVDLNDATTQSTTLNVVNPGPGTKKTFVLEVLDENYDVLYTRQVEKDIADSGASSPDYPEDAGYGADGGGSS